MDKPSVQFGFDEEWSAFEKRHPLFLKRWPNFVNALQVGLLRTFEPKSPAEKVVYFLSNLCREDFMEILLLCGNGYGIGAEKLLRGLYERTVTARYISENPEKAVDFIDFGKINMFKLLEPIRQTHGEDLIPSETVAELTAFHREFKSRGRSAEGVAEGERPRDRSTARWTDDMSFETMAKKVGNLGQILIYGWYLPLFQDHASLQNIIERVRVVGEGELEFEAGPSRKTADRVLNFAMLILLDVLHLQESYFGLSDLEPLLKQCEADYVEIWGLEEKLKVMKDTDTDTDTEDAND